MPMALSIFVLAIGIVWEYGMEMVSKGLYREFFKAVRRMITSLKDRFNDFGESFEYRPPSQCYYFDGMVGTIY